MAYPTDTVFGLGCDPFNRRALNRLYELKGRPSEKGVLVLVPSTAIAASLVTALPPSASVLMNRFWPGPVTLVLPAAKSLPLELTGAAGTVGLRQPLNPFLQAWMEVLGGPVVSTSANRSGEPIPADLAGLRGSFETRVDLFLEAGEPQPTLPSTVVDLSSKPFRVLRPGTLADEVAKVLESAERLSFPAPPSRGEGDRS